MRESLAIREASTVTNAGDSNFGQTVNIADSFGTTNNYFGGQHGASADYRWRRWTVEMFLMFTLGRPDVLPVADYGVQSGFRLAYAKRERPTPKALGAFGARWAPYRPTAAWYLWRAVDLHKAGQLPAPPPRAARKTATR